jgi:hypothetical protein
MSKLQDMVKNSGSTAGAEIIAKMYKPQDIGTDPAIEGIFSIHEDILKTIVDSMVQNGYDQSQPVTIWRGKGVLVDGHTRVKAAIEAGIHEIPGVEKDFENLEDAQRYTYKRQAERRNLTQSEIFQAAVTLGLKDSHDGSGRSSEKLAEDLGVSRSAIVKARTVSEKASEEDINAIKDGTKTINQVYQGVRQKKKKDDDALLLHPSPLTDGIMEEREEIFTSPDIEGTSPAIEDGEITSSGTEIDDPLSGDITDSEEIYGGESKTEAGENVIEEVITLLYEYNEKKAAELVFEHFRSQIPEEDIEGINSLIGHMIGRM